MLGKNRVVELKRRTVLSPECSDSFVNNRYFLHFAFNCAARPETRKSHLIGAYSSFGFLNRWYLTMLSEW